MKKTTCHIAAGLLLGIGNIATTQACDLCAVYSADTANGHGEGVYLGLSEQFTRYDQLRENGRKLPDSFDQRTLSSITQLIVGYGLNDRLTLQLSAPYIHRDYRRPEDGETDSGSASGLGDINLTAQFTGYQWRSERATFAWRLLAGVKLPTGRTGRLKEELGEEEQPIEGEPVSGIHGHDLTLGSGSVDGLFGTSVSARQGPWLARGDVQYALRSRGDFDYQIGDDLQWNVGAGRYLRLVDGQTLAALLNVSGEYKKFDDVSGDVADDTQARTLSVGGQLQGTLGAEWSGDIRADFPIENYGSAVQTASRYRVRFTLVRHF